MNYVLDEVYVYDGVNIANLNSYHIDEFLRRAAYYVKPIKPLLDGIHSHEEISDAIDASIKYQFCSDLIRKALKDHSLDKEINNLYCCINDPNQESMTDVGFALTQVIKEFIPYYHTTRYEPYEKSDNSMVSAELLAQITQ